VLQKLKWPTQDLDSVAAILEVEGSLTALLRSRRHVDVDDRDGSKLRKAVKHAIDTLETLSDPDDETLMEARGLNIPLDGDGVCLCVCECVSLSLSLSLFLPLSLPLSLSVGMFGCLAVCACMRACMRACLCTCMRMLYTVFCKATCMTRLPPCRRGGGAAAQVLPGSGGAGGADVGRGGGEGGAVE
jgi:hypothetical protein